ncbi:MAG TPA: hypothetical protein VK250_07190 [Nitrososphaeraceae archaeon]|nr:hypothetical protein [Nitrososphaeraceae archaeon]
MEKPSVIILTLAMMMIITIPTVLSVHAEKDKDNDDNGKVQDDDDHLTERDLAKLCGATEDYEAHQKQCDKLYDMLRSGEIKDDPDFEYD